MADIRYFNGDRALTKVTYQGGKAYGLPQNVEPAFTKEHGWMTGFVRADRKVEFKSNPSRHECDARCLNATGRVMKCECSCGGKNHGRGTLMCEAA